MSLIDVTDVLFDPLVAGQIFSVVRRQETVNDSGEGVQSQEVIESVVGAIFPVGENSLIREVAAQSQARTIEVVTTFRLRPASVTPAVSTSGPPPPQFPGTLPGPPAGVTWQPDLVYWNGDYFLVSTVEEYTQYGRGFIAAQCVTYDYQTAAPGSLGPPSPVIG
jgi:hypothetical protein